MYVPVYVYACVYAYLCMYMHKKEEHKRDKKKILTRLLDLDEGHEVHALVLGFLEQSGDPSVVSLHGAK
jgi:hypothetical protein